MIKETTLLDIFDWEEASDNCIRSLGESQLSREQHYLKENKVDWEKASVSCIGSLGENQ